MCLLILVRLQAVRIVYNLHSNHITFFLFVLFLIDINVRLVLSDEMPVNERKLYHYLQLNNNNSSVFF